MLKQHSQIINNALQPTETEAPINADLETEVEKEEEDGLLVWPLGFGSNHSLLFFVQNCRHHIETRQIQ